MSHPGQAEPTEHTLSPAIRLPRPVHPHPLQDLAAGSDQPGCGQIWPGSKLTTIGARRGNVAGGVLRRRAALRQRSPGSGCICGCIHPRSVRPGSGHARADDLPILLERSLLISGSTTLKASGGQPPGGSNPSASATSDQHKHRGIDHFSPQRGRQWLHFWWHIATS
jgi:hypothetical protein